MTFFQIFLRIGLLSFGGPAAQIALMQTELVDRHKLISQEDFLKALSFCMLLPGPEAMQLATYVGWHRAGVWGGILAGALFVLPGAVVIATLVAIYVLLGDVPLVQGAFVGIQSVVILIVLQALIRLSKKALKGPLEWTVALVSLVALYALQIPFLAVVVGALAIGAFRTTDGPKRDSKEAVEFGIAPLVLATLWLAPLALIWIFAPAFYSQVALFFSQLAIVSFGGAYAVLAYMTQTVVQDFGWLSTTQMVDALGLAETTPGPLILVTQFVAMLAGYSNAGWGASIFAGVISLWMTFIPCFLWIFAFGPLLNRLMESPRISGALSTLTAAVVGVIASLSLWFALNVFFGGTFQSNFGPLTLTSPNTALFQPIPFAIAAILGVWFILRGPAIHWLLLIAAIAGAIMTLIGM